MCTDLCNSMIVIGITLTLMTKVCVIRKHPEIYYRCLTNSKLKVIAAWYNYIAWCMQRYNVVFKRGCMYDVHVCQQMKCQGALCVCVHCKKLWLKVAQKIGLKYLQLR